jgi:putative transposase
MQKRKQAHCAYRCQYHVVWITKYRYKVLVEGVKEYVLLKIKEVRKYYPEIEYIEVNIQTDHVHVVVSFPPKYSLGIFHENDIPLYYYNLRQNAQDRVEEYFKILMR